jgi:putative acetyltransferase
LAGEGTVNEPITQGTIAIDNSAADDVRALLDRHLALMREQSPPEDVHALDVDGLLDPSVTFFSFRLDGRLLAVGALKHIADRHGELKSMHTIAEARGQGVGRTMLDHLISTARNRGFRRISLETGTQPGFAPARSLYAKRGFVSCRPFGEYKDSPSSVFMTLLLN